MNTRLKRALAALAITMAPMGAAAAPLALQSAGASGTAYLCSSSKTGPTHGPTSIPFANGHLEATTLCWAGASSQFYYAYERCELVDHPERTYILYGPVRTAGQRSTTGECFNGLQAFAFVNVYGVVLLAG